MALTIIEGLDRTGKSTLAEYYKAKGYQVIHQSAPPKGQTADLYLEEQIRIVSSAANKDIVLDRSYYGEFGVWPVVYGRESLLTEEGLDALCELEESVGTTRILMHDPNVEAHWQRCVDNKEPLTRAQFSRARGLYLALAESHGFTKKTLADYKILPENKSNAAVEPAASAIDSPSTDTPRTLSKEQLKLETANTINDVLSKRILKAKGPMYDELEQKVRTYLNGELGKIFGTNTVNAGEFTGEEVELLKFFCGKLKEGKKL